MRWASGDRVILRGEDWRVLRTTAFADCAALDLASHERPGLQRTFLVPFDCPRPAAPPRPVLVSTRTWCQRVSALVADSYPFGGLSCCPPTIRLLPYQLEPALAIFRHGSTRLLIADDVGVGKTVEAGLIIAEVVGGRHGARVLILVPASLKDQWRQELHSLFNLDPIGADADWLLRSSASLPASVNPWSLPGVYLASTDFVKRAEALCPLEDVRWDLLVVDEAHAATPGSHRRAAIHALACRSRLVILLTATPHGGDEAQFEQLCGTGRIDPAEPIVGFRRTRSDVLPLASPVKSRIIRVAISGDERRLHRQLESYTARLWERGTAGADGNPALLATMLRKRALSSAESLMVSLRRRLLLMDAPEAGEVQLWLPLEEEERRAIDDLPADGILGGAGLGDVTEERATIERTLDAAAPAARSESKLRVLLRLLRRVREPAIVFSEYRDTAARLRHVLEAHGHPVIVLDGGMSGNERRAAIGDFNRGGSVLVATDAASEGLNLHHRCRLVIHYELPWTPSRLHQRCGRVNRIGQQRQVHEIALVLDDTAEQLVLTPLIRRDGRAGSFGGGSLVAQLSESRIAARVLGGGPAVPAPDPPPSLPRNLLTLDLREEAAAEAERLELLRRASRHAQPAGDRPPIVSVAHTGRRARIAVPTLTVLFETTIRERTGGAIEQETIAVTGVATGVRWPRRAGVTGSQLAWLIERIGGEMSRQLTRRTRRRLSAVRAMHDRVRSAIDRRDAAIQGALGSAARGLVQAGLFDRLALRSAPPWTTAGLEAMVGTGGAGEQRPVLQARLRVRAVLYGRLE
jgi:superfamily II DNA or RNA helicase